LISEIWERIRSVLVSPGQVSQFVSHTSFKEWDKFKISREETDMAASGCCIGLFIIFREMISGAGNRQESRLKWKI
jgi:hypothetical protein